MKSSHQKILNSLCVMEEFSRGSSHMLEGSSTWRVCLCTRGTETLNYLNPLGFVSREFSLIKEFILISLAIEYLVLMISCVRPVSMFGLTCWTEQEETCSESYVDGITVGE